MRYLHCSDVHVTDDYAAKAWLRLGWRRWIAMAELQLGGRARRFAHAEETLRQIARDAESLAVDHLVLSGDVTAYAMPEEFTRARAALAPWVEAPGRASVIPGNHDRYTPGALCSRRFERSFSQLLSSDIPELAVEDGFPVVRLLGETDAVVGLCSARVPRFPGLSFGVIGGPQLGALQRLVAHPRLAGRAVLVAVHHAPQKANGQPDRLTHGLVDAEKLLALLPGPRFAVLHGHIHHRFHHPATAVRPHIFGAGSSTEAGDEGYWVIETAGGQVTSARALRPGLLTPAAAASTA
ncbi:MAG: metallophosphoesterase family protein [Myxococcaceae bacterium]